MVKITIIAAALPPQLDGIGDYSALLAAELARTQDVTILTGAPTPDPIPGVRIETVFSVDDPRSVQGIAEFVKTNPPDWVLLQYNPFSYGRWGLNLHLPHIMAQIKRLYPQTRFALMVHEPFVPIITPQFAVMATWQRWQLWRLGQTADVVFFSIDPWAKRFQRWFPKKPVLHLPVGSNIPLVPISRQEARARLGIGEDTVVLGLFGTASSGRMLERTIESLAALRSASIPAQVLYVGPHQTAICAALGSEDVIAGGPYAAEEVSRRLSAMDIYLAAYVDGVSTRRGAFMAALQHGIATVGTRGPLTDALLDQEAGKAFLLADVTDPPAFSTAIASIAGSEETKQRLGQEALRLYEREFAWANTARKLCVSLTESANRQPA
jgi:glycosyltransferase involved in cell wall biosynthesis